jgi:small nuclear ribonucleoprotein (snRNP)-like protein
MGQGKVATRSVAGLLLAIIGNEVLVETKTDLEYRGTLDEVDEKSMNIKLSKVAFTRPLHDGVGGRTPSESLDNVFIKGPSIRYVHMPDHIHFETSQRQYALRRARARDVYKAQKRKARPGR